MKADAPATPAQLVEDAAGVVHETLDQLVSGARDAIETLQTRLAEVEADRDGWKDAAEAVDEERDDRIEELESVLDAVRYWFHGPMFLDQPMSDPRKMLRTIERALGEA